VDSGCLPRTGAGCGDESRIHHRCCLLLLLILLLYEQAVACCGDQPRLPLPPDPLHLLLVQLSPPPKWNPLSASQAGFSAESSPSSLSAELSSNGRQESPHWFSASTQVHLDSSPPSLLQRLGLSSQLAFVNGTCQLQLLFFLPCDKVWRGSVPVPKLYSPSSPPVS